MNKQQKKELLALLQTAIEIEYSTIPVYLNTYYSINRLPASGLPKQMSQERKDTISKFANEAGGLVMSIAVEEMLHMSLAGNLIRSLGGMPDLNVYKEKSTVYPTPLPGMNPKFNPVPGQKPPFLVPLGKLSQSQLQFFMGIETPMQKDAPGQGKNWDTIGQAYKYIGEFIEKHCDDSDFSHSDNQLLPKTGFYVPNNVDTIYPQNPNWDKQKPKPAHDPSHRGAHTAQYPNKHDSGHLVNIDSVKKALLAVHYICEQGEGTNATAKWADPAQLEETHWYKFSELHRRIGEFSATEQAYFVYDFMLNPTRKKIESAIKKGPNPAAAPALLALVDLGNAIFTYIFQMVQASYTLSGDAQHMMFNIGVHKAMIFVMDKVVGATRYYHITGNGSSGNGTGQALSPSYEYYPFRSLKTAKEEMIALFQKAPADFQSSNGNILQRMSDLPSLDITNNIIHFTPPAAEAIVVNPS